ncbi:putative aldouronate transport system substrate-binding protein [Paenibacillus sp. 1_12]|uniref:extracellular solute-binding protein n=1 Tax=Paenibacillus sp. 1_12 TaxID=1566278 RepID=UPI0008E2D0AD|nr:extracellular solute-binding protein [Paenibacillus sp. 1_12]SFK99363.1 putative aldouronate transport system substrate-binding protein [Paenibacillus sp. 1_12]
MKKQKNKMFSALLVLTTVSIFTAACSTKDATPAQTMQPDNTSAKTPLKLSMMLPGYSTQLPEKNNSILTKLTEATNVEVTPVWVPSTSYEDKFNITLASGQMPEVMVALTKSSTFINAARNGAFWEVGPYLKDYPNLSQVNPIVLDNISVDGKIYGIYRSRALGRNGIAYRKDWLEKVGLQPPKTIDDFYNMLKAFKTKDPDGNNATGLLLTKNNGALDIMQTWFGVPNQWGQDASGKLVPAHMTPEYMNALQFFKKLYSEQLINQDFPITDPAKAEEFMGNGVAGVSVGVTDTAQRIEEKIWTVRPELKNVSVMEPLGAIEGPAGIRVLPTDGYAGMLLISKTSVKTEGDLRKVLTFLDRLNDKDMQILLYNGIENRHFTMDKSGGVIGSPDANITAEFASLNQMLMFIPEDRNLLPVQTPTRKKVAEVQKANIKQVIGNPAASFISSVYAQKGPQLDSIINDIRIKFIVGKTDENGFKQAIELWRKSGGDDYIKEMNDLYAAKAKK